jgi:hypothetical protein
VLGVQDAYVRESRPLLGTGLMNKQHSALFVPNFESNPVAPPQAVHSQLDGTTEHNFSSTQVHSSTTFAREAFGPMPVRLSFPITY